MARGNFTRWNGGFDYKEALARIQCQTLLLHTHFTIQDNGILNWALTQEKGGTILSLIPQTEYMRIVSNHVVHLKLPKQYSQIVEDFFA